ncbi:jg22906, partial [Pararge aegeria aegeria]
IVIHERARINAARRKNKTRCINNLPSRSRSRSRSIGSRSCRSLESEASASCRYPKGFESFVLSHPSPLSKSRVQSPTAARKRHVRPCRQYNVFPVDTSKNYWRGDTNTHDHKEYDNDTR